MQLPKESDLYPFPTGWYVIEQSENLLPRSILTKQFVGNQIVLFRMENGQACASMAHCPHLGAHLGLVGLIEGNLIRCPFHDFEFDALGVCVKGGYDVKPSPKAKLKMFPILEKNKLIFIWYDITGLEPTWEIPSFELDGWSKLLMKDWKINIHPQTLIEKVLNNNQFVFSLQSTSVVVRKEAQIDEQRINVSFTIHRNAGFWDQENNFLRVELLVQAFGLGIIVAEAFIPEYEIRARYFIFSCPIEKNVVNLKIGLMVQNLSNPEKINPLFAFFPSMWIRDLILKFSFRAFKRYFFQDLKIQENKPHLCEPAFVNNDSLMGLYRKWSEQFYGNVQTE